MGESVIEHHSESLSIILINFTYSINRRWNRVGLCYAGRSDMRADQSRASPLARDKAELLRRCGGKGSEHVPKDCLVVGAGVRSPV